MFYSKLSCFTWIIKIQETRNQKKKNKKRNIATTDTTDGRKDPDPDLSFGSGLVEVEFPEDVKSGDKADEAETHDEDDGG